MKATLIGSKQVASNIKRYYFEPDHKLSQTAGQFIELHLKHDNPDDRGEKRWFTLSSSPTDKYPAITTKQIGETASSFKKALDMLHPGEVIDMSDPMGDFVLPKDASIPLVYVAGGIGITPFLSILEYLRSMAEKRDIHLLYSVADESEAVELEKYKAVLSSSELLVGRLTAQAIYDKAKNLTKPLIFISGPENMVEALSSEIEKMGIEASRIIGDFFPGYD